MRGQGQRPTFIADTIIHEVDRYGATPSYDRPRLFFINASGGCGKTFLANTLVSMTLSRNQEVAVGAWTGIASTLLRFGKTVHSHFKLPVPILSTSTCDISPSSRRADFLRSVSLFFIDEASMIPLHAFRAI